MAKRKNDDESTEGAAQAAAAEETRTDAAQTTDDKGIRRGLGAPPPGTAGDTSEKPIEPGEPETNG